MIGLGHLFQPIHSLDVFSPEHSHKASGAHEEQSSTGLIQVLHCTDLAGCIRTHFEVIGCLELKLSQVRATDPWTASKQLGKGVLEANLYGVSPGGSYARSEITPVHSHIGGMTLMGSLGNCAFSVQEVLEACLVGGYFESFVVGNTKFALDGLCQALDTVDSGRRSSEGNHERLPAYHAASPVSATTDRLNSRSVV